MEPTFTTVYAEEIPDQYQVIKRLGQGTFGEVLLIQDKNTGKPMAVKLVRKDRIKQKAFLKELSLSISLSNHQGIITTYPIFIETLDHYLMTQELAIAGTLHDLIEPQVGMPEEMVKRCAIQLAWALDFMHSRGLVHRDLKPDNVLLMDKECHTIKLCDFGLTETISSIVTKMSHIIPYMSPELCALKKNQYLVITPSVDSWAFAVLLFIALTGNFPWKEAMAEDILYQVYKFWQKSEHLFPPPALWGKFTKEALMMFHKFFSQDPISRPSVLSIINCISYTWKIEECYQEVVTEAEGGTEEIEFVIIQDQEPTEQGGDDTGEFECILIQDQESTMEGDDNLERVHFVILQEQELHALYPEIDPCDPGLIMISENEALVLGSEVEIP
ncbi:serine/threonine-protein kinase SBK1-like [Lithobates pipiens]